MNSIPKSGTHLLKAALDQMPRFLYSGVHVTSTDFSIDFMDTEDGNIVTPNLSYLARRLNPVRAGQYATAHLQAHT